MGIDKFYIPKTLSYEKDYFYHGLLIFGYDNSSNEFDIASYTNNSQYEILKVSYKNLIEGFFSKYIEQSGFLQSLRVRKNIYVEFSIKTFKHWIEQYVYFQNIYLKDNIEKDPFIFNDQSICGILTIDYLKLYIEFINDGKIKELDQRVLRVFMSINICLKKNSYLY